MTGFAALPMREGSNASSSKELTDALDELKRARVIELTAKSEGHTNFFKRDAEWQREERLYQIRDAANRKVEALIDGLTAPASPAGAAVCAHCDLPFNKCKCLPDKPLLTKFLPEPRHSPDAEAAK